MVLGPWRVAGVPQHRPLRGLAADSADADQAVALERVGRERLAGLDPAVVQLAARERFEQVQIDPSVFTVVQYEVPRAFIAPGYNRSTPQPANTATARSNEVAGIHTSRSLCSRVCSPRSASTAHPPPTQTSTPFAVRASSTETASTTSMT